MSCRRVRDWLHRDVEALDAAARLLLDDHLASCLRCRKAREQLLRARDLGASLTVPPDGAHEYSRAIARALLEGTRRAETAPARSRAWILVAASSALAAAALIGVLALRGRGGDAGRTEAVAPAPRSPEASDPPPDPPSDDHVAAVGNIVVGGVVRTGTTAIAAGAVVPADTLLRADTGAGLRLAGAHVVVLAGAELRWVPAARTLHLDRGALELDSPSAGLARVVTGRFVAELDDAALTVASARVHVRRGQVTIMAPSSGLVLARVDAGGEWTLPDLASPTRSGASPTPAATAGELLAQARRQFSARKYVDAARTAEAALALSPRRAEEAEARILLADIAQATGDLALASRRYTAVADAFAGNAAAESALYAAARIELRRGRTDAARTLLGRYLDRFPAGRYADDARRELDALSPAPPSPRSPP
jgi:hypothetical protein